MAECIELTALSFAAGLQIESAVKVPSPPPVKTKTPVPSVEELDAIELSDHGNLVHRPYEATLSPAGAETHAQVSYRAANDLESSQPPTPLQDRVTLLAPSWNYPAMNKWRVLAACLVYFGNGMNDSAPGALIPYIEKWYHIGYAVVSLIWISNAAGFILSAFFTDAILGALGRAKSLMLSELIMIVGYIIIACSPPFPVVVVAYLILGFGNALNLALNNVFCANLANSTVMLGAAHGSYGIGGIVAPIIATLMVTNGIHWARFYLITIGVRCLCFCFSGWAFWDYENESTTQLANSLRQVASHQAAQEEEPNKLRLLGRALRNRVTVIGALFIFAYQGAEVSESGWFISYLISDRHGDPAHVGYVTSGFWAGITLGRFTLTHLAHRVGEKRFVFCTGLGVIAFQVLAWQIPNVIGDAVAVSILGLLLGPLYPCAQTIFTRLLPANIQTTSISFIASAGSSGGALVPFIVGLLAQSAGTFVLHPVCIGAYALMLACWLALPAVRKRSD